MARQNVWWGGGACPGTDEPQRTVLAALFQLFADSLGTLLEGLPEDMRKSLYSQLLFMLPLSIMGAIGGLIYNFWGGISTRFEHFVKRHMQVYTPEILLSC